MDIIFQTPTESKKGGALLYIKDNINCKPRNYLAKEVYKAENLNLFSSKL